MRHSPDGEAGRARRLDDQQDAIFFLREPRAMHRDRRRNRRKIRVKALAVIGEDDDPRALVPALRAQPVEQDPDLRVVL